MHMNIMFIFVIGLAVGIGVAFLQPAGATTKQGPVSDMILGMIGAMLIGGTVAQFVTISSTLILISIVGAIVFVELGRVMPA